MCLHGSFPTPYAQADKGRTHALDNPPWLGIVSSLGRRVPGYFGSQETR